MRSPVLTAIVDQREPEHIRSLSFGGAAVSAALLDAGDLLVMCADGKMLAIERKTADDLLNSIRDGRLFDQCARLRDVSPWAYLVVTGDLRPGPDGIAWTSGRATGFTWSAVAGAFLTVQELGVCTVHVEVGDEGFERAVEQIAGRNRSALRVRPPRLVEPLTEGEGILMSLPGIGPERAAALLKACGSPAFAIQHLSEVNIMNNLVPGIGHTVKSRVCKALGLLDGLSLAVIDVATGKPTEAAREVAA